MIRKTPSLSSERLVVFFLCLVVQARMVQVVGTGTAFAWFFVDFYMALISLRSAGSVEVMGVVSPLLGAPDLLAGGVPLAR